MSIALQVWGIGGIGEIAPGDDVAEAIARAAPDLQDHDIVVVTSKIVSKSEGRLVTTPRERAVDSETDRVVASRGATRIVQTRHGFVLAAAGVDESNVPAGTVALLPVDPDASAQRIRSSLSKLLGVDVAVVVTDTFGRPWRNGLVDVAIGAAGMTVLDDHRGRKDDYGRTLEMTVTAIADEVAAAAELVKGKLSGVPVAVVRGLDPRPPDPDPGARPLVRDAADDMFRLGTREAMRAALFAAAADATPAHDDDAALAAAAAAPGPDGDRTWQVMRVGDAIVGCVADGLDGDEHHRALLGVGAALGNAALALVADGAKFRWTTPTRSAVPASAPDGWTVVAVVSTTTQP